MPHEIQMPDGSIVEFPDDFSDDQIQSALKGYQAKPEESEVQSGEALPGYETPEPLTWADRWQRFKESLGGGPITLPEIPKAAGPYLGQLLLGPAKDIVPPSIKSEYVDPLAHTLATAGKGMAEYTLTPEGALATAISVAQPEAAPFVWGAIGASQIPELPEREKQYAEMTLSKDPYERMRGWVSAITDPLMTGLMTSGVPIAAGRKFAIEPPKPTIPIERTTDAIQRKTTPVLQPVRPQPVESVREMPVREGLEEAGKRSEPTPTEAGEQPPPQEGTASLGDVKQELGDEVSNLREFSAPKYGVAPRWRFEVKGSTIDVPAGSSVETIRSKVAEKLKEYGEEEPAKVATYAGKQLGLDMYEVPGIKPGIVRHISKETALKEGYTIEGEPVVAERPVEFEEPPKPQGTVRLYRGRSPMGGTAVSSEHFSPNREYARNFAGAEGSVDYVDVPIDKLPRAWEERKALGTGVKYFKLPPDVVSNAKELPIQRRSKVHMLEPETQPDLPEGASLAPGAARPEDIGVKSDLTDLTSALKSVTSEKVPLSQQVNESLEISKRGAKNALESAWGGMKGSAAYLWDKVANPPQWDSFKEAVGKWDLQNQQTSFENRKFVQQLNKKIPSKERRAAIRKWIDAGGDAEVLRRGAAETKPQFRKMYQDALNLNPDELTWAKNVQQYFESMADKGVESGLFDNVLEDYIHRAYPKESNWKTGVISEIKSGLLQQNPSLAKQRFYNYDFEAEKAGLTPIHDVGESLAIYDQSFRRALAARTFVKSLMDLTEKDGRPTIDVAGVGVPIEKAGVTEATLVRPKFKTGGTGPLNNRKDYVAYDHPALRRWKWVETGKEGQPIFVQGDVLVHPEAYKKLDALLGRSWWQRTPTRRALIKAGSMVKQTMLDLSGFHVVQIGTHALEHKVNPLKLADIDFTNPVQRDLISHGLVASDTHGQSLYSEGLAGTALTRRIPWVGERLAEYNDWLFKEYIPRIKMTMALDALQRNTKRYSNKLNRDQILKLTADEANAAFGELNYRMMGRHPSTQDTLRMFLLAPDFLEARAKFAGQAATRYGGEQRMALALGAVTLYFTARILNKLIDDDYHWDLEHAFTLRSGKHDYSLRTVQGDIIHLITDPNRFARNRLNPLYGRTALEALTQRNYRGEKVDWVEQLKELASQPIPISLRTSREQKLWESFLSAFAVQTKHGTAQYDVTKLSNEFLKKTGQERLVEVIEDSDSPYRKLRFALADKNKKNAEKALAELRNRRSNEQIFRSMENSFSRPFTGSWENEFKFRKSLTPEQLRIYQKARKEKEDDWRFFLSVWK